MAHVGTVKRETEYMEPVRELARRALLRAAGAPLVAGNQVRILRNASENFPAWLRSIESARRFIHMESYIVHDDSVGREFIAALAGKASQGLKVRLLYDWLGCALTPGRLFRPLIAAGGEVRIFNPPRLDSPFGWLSRDHRKMLTVDGQVAYVTGLCLSAKWAARPERGLEEWRDTGVEVRGPAVADIEEAFARCWKISGGSLPEEECRPQNSMARAGDIHMRVIATEPNTTGLYRLDQFIASIANERLWLTDAYFMGVAPYVQALSSAAMDGVDVRLLVPGGSDLPLLRPFSMAGFRPLLEAGVRVFEWNGPMMHAKTAVADGQWSRVGSTNLNVASWLGNYELDVSIEDETFASEMEEMYLQDLERSTEIVLTRKRRFPIKEWLREKEERPVRRKRRGSAGRAAASALRITNTVGAALTNRRLLGRAETRVMAGSSVVLLAIAVVAILFPAVLAYPLGVLLLWIAITLLAKAWRLRK